MLLEYGAAVDATTEWHETALHLAVSSSSSSSNSSFGGAMVQLLLDQNLDIEARDNEQQTALPVAIQSGSLGWC